MKKIVEATNGLVTPNDFYELPGEPPLDGKAGNLSPFRSRDSHLSRSVSVGRFETPGGHGDGQPIDPNQTDLFHAGASS